MNSRAQSTSREPSMRLGGFYQPISVSVKRLRPRCRQRASCPVLLTRRSSRARECGCSGRGRRARQSSFAAAGRGSTGLGTSRRTSPSPAGINAGDESVCHSARRKRSSTSPAGSICAAQRHSSLNGCRVPRQFPPWRQANRPLCMRANLKRSRPFGWRTTPGRQNCASMCLDRVHAEVQGRRVT